MRETSAPAAPVVAAPVPSPWERETVYGGVVPVVVSPR